MSDVKQFLENRKVNIRKLRESESRSKVGSIFIEEVSQHGYVYNFDWLGLPIIQLPQDIVAVQEIIWKVKPDFVVETGIARGGSLILSASILHLINGNGKVIGVDIDIREHNRKAISEHPLAFRIHMIEGSSTDPKIAEQVTEQIFDGAKVMVILDSHHTQDHVMKEFELYSPLVKKGSYLIVMDTGIEDRPEDFFRDRPWGVGNNPKTAVWEFLKKNDRFEIDKDMDAKLVITASPDGFLKCIKD